MPLRDPFTIAYDTRREQRTLILCLEDGTYQGWGEVVESVFYRTTLEGLQQELETHKEWVETVFSDSEPRSFYRKMEEREISLPLRSALDTAFYDLRARKQHRPLWQYLGLQRPAQRISSFTIGMDRPEHMIRKIHENPWPLYKIKMGQEGDLEILERLRKATSSPFRIDVNGGWELLQALKYLPRLKELKVELLEQPLSPEHVSQHQELKKKQIIPIFADESCQHEDHVSLCAESFDGVNIKMIKAGGITPNLSLIQKARERGLKIMMGCMVESSIGISVLAHLLSLVDHVDMDGALLLAEDPAEGVRVHNGGCDLLDKPGTGAELKSSYLS
ncbi:MAG: dipeptide epimerase [Cytophagales bacterium]|nr:dipeptide epimerase [Cytophagales bacterium]